MSRKAVDLRIPAIIRNGLQERKRSFFILVGDRPKDVIVNLHFVLSNFDPKQDKSVVWAYKSKLSGFTSHQKKRADKIRKEIQRGQREANDRDPFELFLNQVTRFVKYGETDKILGNTYGMCILQDFETVTPNVLARTMETVTGGGLVVLLLQGIPRPKTLSGLANAVAARCQAESKVDAVPRFHKRFILSLIRCEACLVVDDDMDVIPISGGKSVKQLPPPDPDQPKSESQLKLEAIKEEVRDDPSRAIESMLVNLARTADQARALEEFVAALTSKGRQSTVALTADRGRGKSAAMGMAVAAAVAFGYHNIFVTSPSPENLKTFFEFVTKGFDALGYQSILDYSVQESTNPDFGRRVVVRIDVHRREGGGVVGGSDTAAHHQTIQYISPDESHMLGVAELLVIDEAAAIPLPLVRKLMGRYVVFIASTVHGYEGTGRSLTHKLIDELKAQSRNMPNGKNVAVDGPGKEDKDLALAGHRTLRACTLSEPIRYAKGDAVEEWLNMLLLLDATAEKLEDRFSDPEQCQLYKINRDVLFSFNPTTEKFLRRMVSLYVTSHYKNSPDDLQLMSDTPTHELFVLVPPVTAETDTLPVPVCVIQVALEGEVSRESIMKSLGRGKKPDGDLIPYLVIEQFQHEEFASLSGARIVRIATNPYRTSRGYGSRAVKLLVDHYEGRFANLAEDGAVNGNEAGTDGDHQAALFHTLSELKDPALDWVGVSYGITARLHKFWEKAGFAPLYLRQTPNTMTGEYTCVMLRATESSRTRRPELNPAWLPNFVRDFRHRYWSLLGMKSGWQFDALLALRIDHSAAAAAALADDQPGPLTKSELRAFLSPENLHRLEWYVAGRIEYRVILDLLPTVAKLYFDGRLGAAKTATVAQQNPLINANMSSAAVHLSFVDQCILLVLGFQRRSIDDVARDLKMQPSQVLPQFEGFMRRIMRRLRAIELSEDQQQPAAAAESAPGAAAADAGADGAAAPIAKPTTTIPLPSGLLVSRERATGLDNEVIDTRFEPLERSLQDELDEGADEVRRQLREQRRAQIDALPLHRFEIDGDEADWEEAERRARESAAKRTGKTDPMTVTVKAKRKAEAPAAAPEAETESHKRHKSHKKKHRER